MLGSGVLSVIPESRRLQMKGGSRVSLCARSPVPHIWRGTQHLWAEGEGSVLQRPSTTTQLRRKKQVCLMAHLGSSRTGQKFDFQGKLVKACDLLDPALLLQRPQGRRPPARPAFLALSQAPWALGRKGVENYWGVCGECPAQWQHLLNHSSLVPNLTFKRSDVNSWGNPVPWN